MIAHNILKAQPPRPHFIEILDPPLAESHGRFFFLGGGGGTLLLANDRLRADNAGVGTSFESGGQDLIRGEGSNYARVHRV